MVLPKRSCYGVAIRMIDEDAAEYRSDRTTTVQLRLSAGIESERRFGRSEAPRPSPRMKCDPGLRAWHTRISPPGSSGMHESNCSPRIQ